MTVERDCALLERTELQGKLENLEQVLKVRTCRTPHMATVKNTNIWILKLAWILMCHLVTF